MEDKLAVGNAPICWPSPAKLNLFLHITGRLPNGYHSLQTLFQMLDSGDELTFCINDTGEIALRDTIPGVADSDNLVVKAAKLLQDHCNVSRGCEIGLHKSLPMGGGLGGGSSNAATTLVALNHLWGCALSTKELAELGLKLGADVPIFVHGLTAFAEGVGEAITPATVEEKVYLVVHPGIGISTESIFKHPDLPRNTHPIDWHQYQFENTQNDCQQIVINQYPEVEKCLSWLLEYAPSRMTGTGACLFAIFDTQNEAERVLEKLPKPWQGFVAKGVNQSPLRDLMAKLTT